MIAIIGKTCVGKTFLLDKAHELGYSTLNCDLFFAKEYQFGNKCYELIKKNLGKEYVNSATVDKKMLKEFISTKKNKDLLEKLIFPVLFEHFEKYNYDFVEIPILYSKIVNFERFFNKTLNITASMETRRKILKFKNVDNYDFEFFDSINTGFSKPQNVDINMDNIHNNIDWKVFFQRYYV